MSSLLDKISADFIKDPENAEFSPEAKDLVTKAFSDIEDGKYFDYHSHILGLGTNDSGIWLSDELFSILHPSDSIKTQSYIKAAGIRNRDKADMEYLERFLTLVNLFPVKGKFCLLALDKCYSKDGKPDIHNSKLYVPNEWVYEIATSHADKFITCISINPYRQDAVEELDKWARRGVRMVKWMPANMGMDASDPQCEPFYSKMKEHDMVLLTHTGKEENVPVTKFQPLNNPLLFRKPLDMGVKVLMAHCASKGSDPDLDNNKKQVKSYKLFLRLMEEPQYEGLLFGDISALTQVNRMGEPLKAVLERTELHHRLVHGSDYPLPAMNVLISTRLLATSGYIRSEERDALNEIYRINPLLFDFVLKRRIKHPDDPSISFPPSLFMHNEALGIPNNP